MMRLEDMMVRACGSVHARQGLVKVARRAADSIAQAGGAPCSLVLSDEGLAYLELREESSDMELIGTYSGVMPRRTEVLIYDDLYHHLNPEKRS